ncbi:GNAT family N-acetyltransferase [Streptomyces physcomitrii]|uniref:GNAT family N-acetyltransferase n=1 Tax=Streptomyces physcomitrii TaxID=2724184 RepID=A0ABX1GZ94_9ACTN|nr:GNAT family N-acetyltransferase [Streptomyces physcomitrii]NKI40324.1 GNAT family N-acetyltransferase [Streptomyces physcomitrii]
MHPDDSYRSGSDGWHLTGDVGEFLGHAGEFLRSRPALHTTPLSVTEKLRVLGTAAYGGRTPVLGWLERAGEVRAAFHRFLPAGLSVTSLTPGQAEELAAHLRALGHTLPSLTADEPTALAFAEAWRRHTGALATVRVRLRLHRLGTLTPPEPFPAGRGRLAGAAEHHRLMRWCREFAADVAEDVVIDAASWAGTRFAEKQYTFWETPDGTPVSMAGVNPIVGGQARIDPVYTPAHLRGRGYAAAVTTEVGRAALAAGATEVVLYTNAANPTSNALYRRLGYRPLTDVLVHDFAYPEET